MDPQAIRKALRPLRRAGPSTPIEEHVMCPVFLCQKTEICWFQNKVVNLSAMSSSKRADRAI